MMMSSTFLESAGDGDGAARFGRMPDDWMNGIDTTAMPFSGLDAPYEASTQQNPLQSPETPSLDNTVFPSPLTDLAYLDRPFGDFSSNGYAIHPTTPAQFPVHPPHRTSSAFSEGYDLSTGSPSLGAVWPAHVSPAATFLPTPPMADELSPAESEPEEDNQDDDEDYDDDSEPASKKRKRSTATKPRAKGKDGPKRNPTQLRTASRAPKKRTAAQPRHPSETSEEVKARAAHNQVEQQYRKRLNTHFERLLAVLPAPGTEGGIANDRRVSKAEVLDLARERIRALEKQTARLERERRELRGRIAPDTRRCLV
ncbi:Allergen Fus c 3 [Fusarium oxysporum f. sp. cubense]|uniref:Allergen Fus c 3 n=1 Tax=Fusarium oxysporum f. sp. cubense TaxID=61366 RepID=A0A559KX82_FUSOC|nr:Allergen Fus c 3 [Fusarium oxysporum f. sp. cubense]